MKIPLQNELHCSTEKPFPLVRALSDFFGAQDHTGLEDAYLVLKEHAVVPAPDVTDWMQVEFAFNRLFVGPQGLAAPPYASVYLDSEPTLMGQSTLQIRQVYHLLGLTSPEEGAVPDDHISLELDAYWQLRIALSRVDSAELSVVRHHLCMGRLQRWVPPFCRRVRDAEAVPGAILFVVDQLESWLTSEVAVEWATTGNVQATCSQWLEKCY